MFYFGKDYIKLRIKKALNFFLKLAIVLFSLISIGSMWYFLN